MIEVSCYNCGSAKHTLYAVENGCNLVKCSGCGLLYVNPRPSDSEIEEGAKLGVHKGEQALDSTGRFMNAKVAIYLKVLNDIYHAELKNRTRTWLDVGCGHGELLVALHKFSSDNVKAKGLEPNRHKVKAASEKGLDVSYFDLSTHRQQYDCISILNVYSHLTNPLDFFSLLRSRLNPKGELLVETGDSANLSPEDHYRPFLLPDHLSFGSEEIISGLLRRSGFEIVSANKYPALKLQFMKKRVMIEMVKLALPNKRSQIPTMISHYRARKHKTDMWIRARLKS